MALHLRPLLIFARELEKSRLITVLNASDQERELPLSEPKVRNLLTGAVLPRRTAGSACRPGRVCC